MNAIEFHSRYGGPDAELPDPETVCLGQCEGMGCVPVHRDDAREPWRSLWLAVESVLPTDDGWHFVGCPACGGKRPAEPAEVPAAVESP